MWQDTSKEMLNAFSLAARKIFIVKNNDHASGRWHPIHNYPIHYNINTPQIHTHKDCWQKCCSALCKMKFIYRWYGMQAPARDGCGLMPWVWISLLFTPAKLCVNIYTGGHMAIWKKKKEKIKNTFLRQIYLKTQVTLRTEQIHLILWGKRICWPQFQSHVLL